MPYVYLIQDTVSGLVKIGMATNPVLRLSGLQTGTANPLRLLHLIEACEARRLEAQLHEQYAAFRVSREWFKLSSEQVLAITQVEPSPCIDKGAVSHETAHIQPAPHGMVEVSERRLGMILSRLRRGRPYPGVLWLAVRGLTGRSEVKVSPVGSALTFALEDACAAQPFGDRLLGLLERLWPERQVRSELGHTVVDLHSMKRVAQSGPGMFEYVDVAEFVERQIASDYYEATKGHGRYTDFKPIYLPAPLPKWADFSQKAGQ